MNKETILLDLKPERSLLNPSFEGYKLSLDPIPIYRKTFESGVHVRHPSDEQFSFSHVKMFSLHNHLHGCSPGKVFPYFVDKNLEVFKVWFSSQNEIQLLRVGYKICGGGPGGRDSYNVSMAFPSGDRAVVSDGSGGMCLVQVTEQTDRGAEVWQNPTWLCKDERPFILLDASFVLHENSEELHILSCLVQENNNEGEEKKEKAGLFQTLLCWTTFVKNVNLDWEKARIRKLSVNGSIDYVALEPRCQSIYVISDKLPKWVSDTEKPTDISLEEDKSVIMEKTYIWNQNDRGVTIRLLLPPETTKSDLTVSTDDLKIDIKLKSKTILNGNFFHKVDKDLTLWAFEKNQLEIQLTKIEQATWKTLLREDDKGEETIDPDVIKNIHHQTLMHLCVDQEEGGQEPVFNSQQLEECDAVSCNTTNLVRINGNNHFVTHQISLSSLQWLFKVSCEENEASAICCRHDVDACVWQFKKVENDVQLWPHQHIGTFSAFGYVQASKSQKKFLASPPDLSYACICESSHHVYIYHQPTPILTELKNRSTGKKINNISKQQLVNLESKEQILGVYATKNLLFVLLETSICILSINL